MGKAHGSLAYLKINSLNMQPYTRTVNLNRNGESVDVTTLAATDHDYLAGLRDATFGGDGVFDPAVDTELAADLAQVVTWEIGPQGNGSGKVKWSGSAILTRYNPTFSTNDAGKFTFEFQ